MCLLCFPIAKHATTMMTIAVIIAIKTRLPQMDEIMVISSLDRPDNSFDGVCISQCHVSL